MFEERFNFNSMWQEKSYEIQFKLVAIIRKDTTVKKVLNNDKTTVDIHGVILRRNKGNL